MTLTIQQESWATFYPDFLPIWETEHAGETCPQRLPDHQVNTTLYAYMDQTGVLEIYTARRDGQLAGYLVAMVMPYLHASCWVAQLTLYFVRKEARQQGVWTALLSHAEAAWRAQGILAVSAGAKVHLPYGAAFAALGYAPEEMVYLKWLDESLVISP